MAGAEDRRKIITDSNDIGNVCARQSRSGSLPDGPAPCRQIPPPLTPPRFIFSWSNTPRLAQAPCAAALETFTGFDAFPPPHLPVTLLPSRGARS